MLGYSPSSALGYYLAHPDNLSTWDGTDPSDTGREARTRRYWEAVETIMTPEQFAVSRQIASHPKQLKKLDVLADSTNWEDYVYRTPHNTAAQAVLRASGMDAYVQDMRTRMYGHEPDESLKKSL